MFQGEEQIPEGLAPEARISQEKAVETALKVLRAANVPGDLSAATVTYGPGRGGTSLRGASWEIARSDTYQGIDCMSGLMMRISAYSGRVLAFHYTPPVIPESMEIRISKEDAIQRALDRCYNVAHMTGFVQSNIEPTLYIVTPGPKAGLQAKARLCWRVMLTTRTPPPKGEGTGNQSCSVDCVTGEVIAGLGAP
jgi:hypothetical protein